MSLLLLPAPALSQDPGDQSPSPSVDQYRESVPTAKGSRPAAPRADRRPGPALSREARARLRREAGADARALEDIATDPGLGAPETAGPGGRGVARADGAPFPVPAPAGRSGVASAAEAAVGGGSGGTTVLLLGLAGITAAVGVAAAVRRRRPPAA